MAPGYPLADGLFLVMSELMAKEDSSDGILYDMRFRFSLLSAVPEGVKTDFAKSQCALSFTQLITMSIRAAKCPGDRSTYDGVWNKADQALYMAKKSGKNKIRVHP